MSLPNGLNVGGEIRRNSVLVTRTHNGVLLLHKRYLRTFNVDGERHAYARLRQVIATLLAFRVPMLHDELAQPGEIVMEFVAGPTLAQQLARGDIAPLERHRVAIVSLLAAAQAQHLAFDCDPSNMILADDRIVLVDPMVQALPLQHLSVAIFLHGLVKAGLRCGLQPWTLPRLRRAARALLDDYAAAAGVTPEQVLADLADYQTTVIDWNREMDPNETLSLWLFRRLVLIPVYAMIRAMARWQSQRV
ncbi:MAG: hypothetical protein AABY95_04040 [Pseudomonadota bacterium]